MPKYVYACDGCLIECDVTTDFGAAPDSFKCSCGGQFKRVYTAVGAIFKGTGWGKDKR